IGARRITVSTSGLLAGIRRFAAEPEQFTLAVSLHSAVQTTRDALMPSLRGQTLVQLHEALQDYIALSGRRVSLEYALVQGQNDTPSEIAALKRFCLGIKAHVNLIPLNPGGASPNTSGPLAPSAAQQLREVERELLEANIECSVRRSRGADIAAACGQLAGR
ncbi:MAG: 23S rRNA (adenine(2503)-C(2))-methyltransferase RlmN, partial [Coriobacteriia bacterium]|nr:23S rRNA (adenine(2503)-C(2))-methyltransferase RlmN [Coriobacteriia bacterium]